MYENLKVLKTSPVRSTTKTTNTVNTAEKSPMNMRLAPQQKAFDYRPGARLDPSSCTSQSSIKKEVESLYSENTMQH